MLTIGRVARKAGVSTDCVRFYERVGLLAAAGKTPAGYRLYDEECVRRLLFIKHAQRCGFSLPQIRELLHADTPAGHKATLRLAMDKKQEIEQTISALRAMGEALSSYIRACDAAGKTSDGTPAENILVAALSAHIAGPAGSSGENRVSAVTRLAPAGAPAAVRYGLS
jgi:DNA-binding transcriptional MerR regulator